MRMVIIKQLVRFVARTQVISEQIAVGELEQAQYIPPPFPQVFKHKSVTVNTKRDDSKIDQALRVTFQRKDLS